MIEGHILVALSFVDEGNLQMPTGEGDEKTGAQAVGMANTSDVVGDEDRPVETLLLVKAAEGEVPFGNIRKDCRQFENGETDT